MRQWRGSQRFKGGFRLRRPDRTCGGAYIEYVSVSCSRRTASIAAFALRWDFLLALDTCVLIYNREVCFCSLINDFILIRIASVRFLLIEINVSLS